MPGGTSQSVPGDISGLDRTSIRWGLADGGAMSDLNVASAAPGRLAAGLLPGEAGDQLDRFRHVSAPRGRAVVAVGP
jgi:hypothetical protein